MMKMRMRGWLLWGGVLVATLALMGGMVLNWRRQVQADRDFVRDLVVRIPNMTRAELTREWHVPEIKPFNFRPKMVDLLHWDPSSTATLALAVMPRNKSGEFEAIYAAYEAERAVATLAVTPVAAFAQGQEINPQRYPQRWVARAMSATEVAGLKALRELLESRRATFNPQAPEARWLEQVIAQLDELLKRQGDVMESAEGMPAGEGSE